MDGHYDFCLYVAANSAKSAEALANLHALCKLHLHDRHQVRIVDVFLSPRAALDEGIFLTPTLIKLAPGPVIRIVGTLQDETLVLRLLGLPAVAA